MKRGERVLWVAPLTLALLLHLLSSFFVANLDPRSSLFPNADRSVTYYQIFLEPEPEPPPQRERQIVSVDAPATEEIPEDARFEDRVNRDVEVETVGPLQGVAPAPTPPLPTQASNGAQENRQDRDQEERNPEAQDEEDPTGAPDRPQADQDLAGLLPDPESESTEGFSIEEARIRGYGGLHSSDPNYPPEESGDDEPLELAAFSPTLETASDFVTVPGGGLDHLDLPQGDRTEIDSIENVYWSYWDRIKNQVRPHWRPSRVYREHDPTGRIFGVEDRYTILRVTLNGDGTLRHVYLERSSELDFLDNEAIRAVRDAAPFSNIPEGLKDESGLLSFRFGFYFEVSSSSFRIRREEW